MAAERAALYMITVPGLLVKSDWAAVHDRLLDDFPQVADVLPTTMSGTLLIVYQGPAEVDAWLDDICEAILTRRLRVHRGAHGVAAPSPWSLARGTDHRRVNTEFSTVRSFASAAHRRSGDDAAQVAAAGSPNRSITNPNKKGIR